ncbi:ATP-binding protein [Sphingomonas sp.]|jgi:signal transduction histidine kinase|uniref:ATP-binding protein n=1 Tax=Sphingomonas sp. TaxID=28214 RepID=UPI002E0DB011|nr:ATP-binding protein [Sphingomonas sp.]
MMLRGLALFLCWLALGLAVPAAAQQRAADTLIENAKSAMVANPQTALTYAEQAQRQAATIPDVRARATAEATALWLQSEALVRLRKSAQAAPRISRALRLISADQSPIKLRGDLLIARAGVQEGQMRFAEALASLQEAHNIFAALNEKRNQSIALQLIASLYTKSRDLRSAEKYYKQAAAIYNDDARLQMSLLNNRGNVLLQLEEPRQAEQEYRKALQLAKAANATNIPQILTNIAHSLLDQKRFAEADAIIAEASGLIRLDPEHNGELALLAVAAESARRQGRIDSANRLIQRAFAGVDLAKTPLGMRDAHHTAYQIYRVQGNSTLALVHLERLRKLNDEAAKLATSASTALMAARFDYANQELRIANLQAAELRRAAEFQRTLFIGLGGASLVIVTLLSIGLFTIRRSRNQVRQANTVLAETNVALEKALKAKTEFLATTSHEIRTPLNGILGMTQIMLRDASVPEETRDRINIVHGAGMTMRALVDDILDVAKMETGNLTVEMTATDLHTTLHDVTRIWEEQAHAKGLAFTLSHDGTPRWIETDPGRLRQIVFNLLSNAVKFTETGALSVVVEASGERLRVAIRDTGIGIPADKFDEVFESFKQVDAGTTRQFGGTGLGLAIVRNLAHALGGTVSVASVVGEGSTFTVDLPLRPAEVPDSAIEVTGEGETVVVLDRNPIVRGMMRALFTPHFAAVHFAASIDEAVALARGAGPALILADQGTLAAGEADPIEKLTELAAAAPADVRTAALWSKPEPEAEQRLYDTGIDLIIVKPVKGPALVAALTGARTEICATSRRTTLVSQAA